MYEQSSVLIAAVLFVTMAVAIEAGYRVASQTAKSINELSRANINAIQGSLLGVLALLLGFTFAISMQRFDSRSDAVVDEANAIGTTWLRAQLLPVSVRSDVQDLLRGYVDLRVREASVTLVDHDERKALLVEAGRKLDALWRYAVQAAEEDGRPVTSGLFIQALNEMVDAYSRRDSALNRHVPEVVLFLLYFTFLMTGSLVGYATGVAGHRTSFATYILVGLIVLLVFIIIDLDRPRRGLIEVNQASMIGLHTAIGAGQASDGLRIFPGPGE
ncbi:MAG: hypothetical protein Q8N51_18850 [Gammaproteobacteria bacterium]|nr:hypothetical protein [Gammaproteobacteria bacterium]